MKKYYRIEDGVKKSYTRKQVIKEISNNVQAFVLWIGFCLFVGTILARGLAGI